MTHKIIPNTIDFNGLFSTLNLVHENLTFDTRENTEQTKKSYVDWARNISLTKPTLEFCLKIESFFKLTSSHFAMWGLESPG